jgi:hypothetical protein
MRARARVLCCVGDFLTFRSLVQRQFFFHFKHTVEAMVAEAGPFNLFIRPDPRAK